MDFNNLLDQIATLSIEWGLKLVYALIALLIGLWIIRTIVKGVKKRLVKGNMEPSLQTFATSMISIILKVLLVLSVMEILGTKMTSFVAILGAAGLAIGMALSGTLQNFAGSVMILIFKPYKVGEFIEAQGHQGVVKEIQIFVTELLTPDNKTIYVPNGPMSNGSIVNYSRQEQRRVDLTFGIAYSDDIDKAKAIIHETLANNPLVLKNPGATVTVSELADSSVNFATRPWCNSADYWTVFFALNEEIKKAFDKNGISIPFPQRDVYNHTVK